MVASHDGSMTSARTLSLMKHKLLALVLGFTATAVAILPATPAFANLNLYRVSGVSAYDAVSPKNATVSCNAGDQMLSVGGRINDGMGDVLLTRAYANNAMNLATASGIEAIATNNNWSVEVFAVCAPAGTVANLSLQQNTLGADPNDKTVVVNCPAGTKAYGGGFKLENANGAIAIDELIFDTSVNVAWVLATSFNFAAAPNYSLTVQAFCGTAAPIRHEVETWPSADNSITPKTETTPTCAGNAQVSGAGGELTGALGTVGLATVLPRPQLTVGEATGREIGNTNNTWIVEAYAICVE